MSQGRSGGELYTPSSILRLLTEVIEPNPACIFDAACDDPLWLCE
jgi:type I restriction enzyme M protein